MLDDLFGSRDTAKIGVAKTTSMLARITKMIKSRAMIIQVHDKICIVWVMPKRFTWKERCGFSNGPGSLDRLFATSR